MSRVVLVTGVARQLGARMAARLAADPAIDKVVGVDVIDSTYDTGGAEFVRADIRRPELPELLYAIGPDSVVHMNVLTTPRDAGGRVPQKEINIIGTMQLLGACQKSDTVRSVVVKSSTVIYGGSSRDPALFTEGMSAKVTPRRGFPKDSLEVEAYVRGFARRRPDIAVTILRFANFMGPTVRTPLTEYFSLPVIPTILGFDARLQFVHEDDGIEALHRAAVEEWHGTYNLAGDGILLVSQAVRRAGRPELPIPRFATAYAGQTMRTFGIAGFTPEMLTLLSYGRGVDTTRIRAERDFVPRFSTAEAFTSFVEARGSGPFAASRVHGAEEAFVSGLEAVDG